MVQPIPPDPDNTSQNGIIKIGFLRIPRSQLFPILLVFVLLVSGVGILVVATDNYRVVALVAIIIGLGWSAMIYQNIQNRRFAGIDDANKKYEMTIVALSNQGHPLKGASVTVLGPIAFTDRRTNQDGRVIYKYMGRDADNFRNREVAISVEYNGAKASTKVPLMKDSRFVEVKLDPTLSPAASTVKLSVSPSSNGEVLTMAINPALYERIISVIVPHVANLGSRTALVNRAFFNSPVANKINIQGNAADFAADLVTQLNANEGPEGIVTLLETLRKDLGTNKKREIDALISELRV